MNDYAIWKRYHHEELWSLTSEKLKARTDKEAQAKLRRKFQGCGFSSMSLIAMLIDQSPNIRTV